MSPLDRLDVPIESVELGDVVIVRPGEQMPVDGVIVNGRSAVDESMLRAVGLDRASAVVITFA